MPIQYKIVKRKSPKDASVKFYAQSKISGATDLHTLARRMSKATTVTEADSLAVLTELEEVLAEALLESKSVRLGKLGSFHVTLKSSGAESKEDFSHSNITKAMIRFIPSPTFKKHFLISNTDEMKLRNVEATEKSSTSDTKDSGGNTGGDVNPNA